MIYNNSRQNAVDIRYGNHMVQKVYQGNHLVWERGSPPGPDYPFYDYAINFYEIINGVVMRDYQHFHYAETLEDARSILSYYAKEYPDIEFDVVFGDNCYTHLCRNLYPGYPYGTYYDELIRNEFENGYKTTGYNTGEKVMNNPFEYTYGTYPYSFTYKGQTMSTVNRNIRFLTLGEGFRYLYAKIQQDRNLDFRLPLTLGTLFGLEKLTLPSSMVAIDSDLVQIHKYNSSGADTGNVSTYKWNANLKEVVIHKPHGSIQGAPWGLDYDNPNLKITWTG